MTERDIRTAVQRRPGPGRDAIRMPGANGSGERAPGRRRVLGKAILATALLPLAGAVWIGVTGLIARWELLAAQQDLDALRHSVAAPGSASGKATTPAGVPEQAVRSAAAHASRAHRLTTGPAWYSAAELPFLGGPVRTVRGAAYAADRLAGDVLPSLTAVLPPSTAHGSGGGMSDALASLQRHGPEIVRAAGVVAEVRTDVHGLPRSTWLTPADRARAGLQRQLDRLAPVMTDAAVAARVLPPMLGTQGQRRYFLAFQNIAEARGTGGVPGAFAVLRADRGRLSFERFGNNTEMMETAMPDVDLGADFDARYAGSDPIHVWPNSNMSPHFPYAARIWAAAWRKHTGERVDGAIAVDPVTLSRLLRVTGPTRMADGTELTADNVVDLTERASYSKYDDIARRKAFFVDAARAAAARLMGALDDTPRLPALLVAVNDAQRDGRLKVWSAHTAEQRLLESRPYSGTLPNAPGPFAGLVVNNAAGGKLDYYLGRSLTWEAGACSSGHRTVTATMTLTNRAPTSGLPDYVTMRADSPPYRTRPGDNRLMVSYYAGVGATLVDATLDGRRALLAPAVERGHSVFTLDLELPATASRTLVLHLLEPHADGAPTLLRQSLATPQRTTLKPGGACRV